MPPSLTAREFQCRMCLQIHAGYAARCTACGSWDSYVDATQITGRPSVPAPLNTFEGAGGLKMQTGIPQLDAALSGGFMPGLPVILLGEYGLGKSTLALQAAFWIGVRAKRQSLYVSGEEGGAQVLERCRRIGLTPEWIYFTNPADLGNIRRHLMGGARPPLIVIDSLQCLDDASGKGRDETRQWRAFKQLLALAGAAKAATLILSQVNARGNVKGGPRYGHEVDAILKLCGAENSPQRQLFTLKNRNGKSKDAPKILTMTAEGLR